MSSPRLTCLTKRMPHHGAHAGYSAVIPYLGADRVIEVASTGATRWVGAVSRRVLGPARIGSQWWGLHSAAAELRAAAATRSGDHVVHVLYGEDLLGLLPRLPNRRRRVVATFHQPWARIEQLQVPVKSLEGLAAVIVLDESSAARWQEALPSVPVHALRLGVNTEFWTPGTAVRNKSCLIVGGHLRDLELLATAIEALDRDGVEVDLVGMPATFSARFEGRERVRRHERISDEALRGLYQRAGVFLLGLRQASGSNALLQAMATGCPIVTTDLPSVRSYLDEASARWCPPGDAGAHLDAVRALLEDDRASAAQSGHAQLRAQTYALASLGESHRRIYEGL